MDSNRGTETLVIYKADWKGAKIAEVCSYCNRWWIRESTPCACGGARLWKLLTFTVAIPTVTVFWINSFIIDPFHPVREEFRPYAHLRMRTKPFPWGDGNHTLFHNKEINPLPEGYED